MTKGQSYIILAIMFLSILIALFYNPKENKDFPNSIGDPLELVLVKNQLLFNHQFYNKLKQFLSSEIGIR